jgi:hypothetical protein
MAHIWRYLANVWPYISKLLSILYSFSLDFSGRIKLYSSFFSHGLVTVHTVFEEPGNHAYLYDIG